MDNVIVVMPAYNAGKTLTLTYEGLPKIFDRVILCDDSSKDGTFAVSQGLGLISIQHQTNRGYGANQKTLYNRALEEGADIIIMVHPDNQYNTACLPAMIEQIKSNPRVGMILGSRMASALHHRMPIWKYVGNRFLTTFQNLVFGTKLSEFHSGLRAYPAKIFKTMPYQRFSDDFVFDSEVIAWLVTHGYEIGEVPTECYYNTQVSSVNFRRSVTYGFSTLETLVRYIRGYYKKL
jgi:glycosyltransferase involved in cell wall biosynthesis